MHTAEAWYLSASDRGRRRLFPRGIVGVFALSLLLVGWLALPNKSLHDRLANAHETDLLTVAYLNAWINATPKDWRLRLTIARHQALIGHHKEALATIELILTSGPPSYEPSALRLRLNVLERMAFELPRSHPRRAVLMSRVRYELERIALTATDAIEIEAFLRRAEALEHPALAAKLLARLPKALADRLLASGTVGLPPELARLAGRPVEDLARRAIGLGDFRLAADLYWRAFDLAEERDRRLSLLMMVSRAEQAGNRLAEFFVAFESRMDRVTLDTAAYKRLARLALSANRLDLAEIFARRMLKFSGWWQHLRPSDAPAVVNAGWQWLTAYANDFTLISSAAAATVEPAALKQTTVRSATMAVALARARARLANKQGGTLLAMPVAIPEAPRNPYREEEVEVMTTAAQAETNNSSGKSANADVLARARAMLAKQGLTSSAPGTGLEPYSEPNSENQPDKATRHAATSIARKTQTEPIPAKAPTTAIVAPTDTTGPKSSTAVSTAPTGVAVPGSSLERARAMLARQGLADSTQQLGKVAVQPAPLPQAYDEHWPAPQASQPDPLAQIIQRARKRYAAVPRQSWAVVADTKAASTSFDKPRSDKRALDEGLRAARANPMPTESAASESPAGVTISPRLATVTVITQPPRPVEVAIIETPRLESRLLNPAGNASAPAPLVAVEPNYQAAVESSDGIQGAVIASNPARLRDENFNRLLDTLAALTPYESSDESFGSSDYATGLLTKPREPLSRPRLRFEHESYLLAYQVFLARANLDDAYAVADAAVRQLPDSLTWRERLAQVAEWSQRPTVALDNWLLLGRARNDTKAWGNVQRLSASLRDEHRSIEYFTWELKRNPTDHQTALELAKALERLGEPERAIEWLQQHIAAQQGHEPIELLIELANVAERNGDPDLLVGTLTRANNLGGATPERAVRIAATEFRRSRVREAFNALRQAEPLALDIDLHNEQAETKTKYWSTYAELARLLGKDELSLQAYRQMLTLEVYETEHLESLASVLQVRSHVAAAQVMTHAFERSKNLRHARNAVAMFLRGNDIDSAQAFLASLSQDERLKIESSIEFLKQRASFYQASSRWKEARRDILSVYKQSPSDMNNRAGLIWLLMAEKNARGLRAVLSQWEKLSRKESKLWGPFGAALLSLGDAPKALKYFVWQSRNRKDYLWWLAYADALDATGRTDAAWKLRKRAWTELREAPLARMDENAETRDRVVALAMRFGPADQARGLLADLVRERDALTAPTQNGPGQALIVTPAIAASSEAPVALAAVVDYTLAELRRNPIENDPIERAARSREIKGLKSTANELAISYLLSQEELDSARGWLLSRYADQLAQPTWARLSVALANHDNEALDQLLTTLPDWLPKLDRIEALVRLGRNAQSQSEAFTALVEDPDSNRSHQKLIDTIMTGSPSAGVLLTTGTQGVIDVRRTRVDAGVRIDQHANLWFFGERERMGGTNPAIINDANVTGQTVGVGLLWKRNNGDLRAQVSQRDMLATSTGVRARWQMNRNPWFSLAFSGGINQPTGELVALSVGGQRDYLGIDGRINLTGRDYLSASLFDSRYETQLETRVASGRRVAIEYGHRFRLDYPDITAKLGLSNATFSGYNASDPIIARLAPSGSTTPLAGFIPSSSSQANLFVAVGQAARDNYTRGLRPFGEGGVSFNNESKWGYSLRGGLSTSFFGADQFQIYGAYTSKSPGNTRGTRELGLSYRLHY